MPRQSFTEKILFPVKSLNEKKLAAVLRNKTVLITGASYGIGAATAVLCSKADAGLILVARTTEKLQEVADVCKANGASVTCFTADLREEKDISRLLAFLKEEKIGIDIFISNAGKSIYRRIEDSADRFHDTKRCAAVNYIGPVQLLIGLLPGLTERRGQIINISAANVLLPPSVGWSAYQSSKAAFDQWLRCAEPELFSKGISVSSIYLPLVRTGMSMVNKNKHHQPAMSKQKAATLIAGYIISRKRKYTPWWLWPVTAAAALFPDLWYRIQRNKEKKTGHVIHP